MFVAMLEHSFENITDNLASDSQNKPNNLTKFITFDDTNSDLHSAIPLVLANNNPHQNSSISLLTT